MKKIIIYFFIGALLSSASPVYAQYSSAAYGGTKNETMLNRVSDWFATVGKSQEEKYRIMVRRRADRKITKAKKAIAKKKKQIAKQKKAFQR